MSSPDYFKKSISLKCPLCFFPSYFFVEGENREYYFCPCCSMVFVPYNFFLPRQQEINRYLEHKNSLENRGYVSMFETAIKYVNDFCGEISSVLDYGCGYEPVLKILLEKHGYLTDIYDNYFFPEAKLKKNTT